MTRIVLDTNVISELTRLRPEPRVLNFLRVCEEPIVSAVVFHEIAYGIERHWDKAKRAQLEQFLKDAREMYQAHVVEVDLALAELSGRLRARASRSGWVLSQFDSVIAATAIEKGARLATRNIADFERLNIPLINPWID